MKLWGCKMKKLLLCLSLLFLFSNSMNAYLYDDFSDGYLNPDLWIESMADNVSDHVEYHYESNSEEKYHTEKVKILTRTGVEGHNRTLDKVDTAAQNRRWGWKMVTNSKSTLKTGTKSPNSDAIRVYLLDSDGSTELATSDFDGNDASFDVLLEAHKIYYIVAECLSKLPSASD